MKSLALWSLLSGSAPLDVFHPAPHYRDTPRPRAMAPESPPSMLLTITLLAAGLLTLLGIAVA